MLEFDIRRVRSFLHWGCVRRVIGSEERIDGNLFVEFKGLFMKCPICVSVDLLMSERKGIEIDYCPSCRGVWLDRGELDKFIQQAEQQSQAQSFGSVQAPGRFQQDVAPRYEKQDDDHRIPDPRSMANASTTIVTLMMIAITIGEGRRKSLSGARYSTSIEKRVLFLQCFLIMGD